MNTELYRTQISYGSLHARLQRVIQKMVIQEVARAMFGNAHLPPRRRRRRRRKAHRMPNVVTPPRTNPRRRRAAWSGGGV